MRFFLLCFLVISPLLGSPRDEAITKMKEATAVLAEHPALAAQHAATAFTILKQANHPEPQDLASCAAFSARAWRDAGNYENSRTWFKIAISLVDDGSSVPFRTEIAELLMRDGQLAEARKALNIKAQTDSFWAQTSAKLHLTTGRPDLAERDLRHALEFLLIEEPENRAALLLDLAGTLLRQDRSTEAVLREADQLLSTLDAPHPEFFSSLISIRAQTPSFSSEEKLTLLQSGHDFLEEDPRWKESDARFSYAVALAEAAAESNQSGLVKTALSEFLTTDPLPNDHPLRARALFLAAEHSWDQELAKESSATAMRWLKNSSESDSNFLLGLQRVVDPISPLLIEPIDLDLLRDTLFTSQNFALRKRLNGTPDQPEGQSIHFFLYQKNNLRHYGALILKPNPVFIPLGKAEKIHQRLRATIDTAERTLAEVSGSSISLTARLTQLWKSIWQPLVPHLDSSKALDISPTGLLHFVPWATLRSTDGRFLCQDYETVRVLALTGNFPTQALAKNFLTIGYDTAPGIIRPTIFPYDEPLTEKLAPLGPLAGVKFELAQLSGTSFLNPSESRLREHLQPPPGILHIAGHGFILDSEDGSGFRAGITLGKTLPGQAERDNILFAHEIAELDLASTELVVLSACRGGIGRSEAGGNWSSLRRSFLAAGAKQVLAAQWRVRDDELATFMHEFHKRRETQTASTALWDLQRAWLDGAFPLIEEKSMSHRAASAGPWVLEMRP